MYPIYFQQIAMLLKGNVYSLLLQGAITIPTDHEYDLALYRAGNKDDISELAQVISQKHFRFCDLVATDVADYYTGRVASVADLHALLQAETNNEFDTREIVTIVRFKIV